MRRPFVWLAQVFFTTILGLPLGLGLGFPAIHAENIPPRSFGLFGLPKRPSAMMVEDKTEIDIHIPVE